MLSVTEAPKTSPQDLIRSLSGKRLAVYAGTLESYQGIDIVLRAFRYVIDAEPDAFLLVVGGTKAQVDYYSGMAVDCGIDQHCLFTGRVPKDLAKYYADHADIQLSPRISGTNTPLKIYEQLARGLPLVATNIFSHTQVLTDEVAFLVEPEPQSIAEGMLTAMRSPEESQRRARNAQQLYEEKYSRRVYKEKMKKLLALISK
jgi:glycosyltransferase involved in cell wall biosynthesis